MTYNKYDVLCRARKFYLMSNFIVVSIVKALAFAWLDTFTLRARDDYSIIIIIIIVIIIIVVDRRIIIL